MAEPKGIAMTTVELPTSLFHYTSIQGVEGILKTKSVWASILHFMNDSQEWLYSLDLVKRELEKRATLRDETHWLAFIAEISQALNGI
jgi:hypothetical protein